MVRVIDKEVVQEPELEEPGYQIYTVKEAVLEEDWTEESAGHQEILTEQMSTEQPETCLVKEEVLEEDWTEDDRGQELLTQPTSTEQPETCLVKEEVLEEDWTEDDRGQELLTQPTLTEQPETCLVKEEVLEEDWTEDGRGQELLTQPTSTEQPETCLSKGEEMSDEWTEDSEGGHGIVKEPQSGGWTEDLEATGRPLWLQIVPLEESIHKRDLTNSLQEERRRTEEGNSKEVERELSDESDCKMYEVKEEPLESSCTENDDLANLKMLVQAPLLAVKSNSESKNTKRQLKHSRQVFQEFCKAGDIEFDQLSDVNLETLDQLLGKFYTGVKSSSDKSYSAKSMQALRYGLQKHFLHLRDIDIIRDRQFATSRSVFNAVIQKLKRERKADVEPVSESDMNKIHDSLDQDTPCGLQSKVFVDICSNFAFRGVEEVYDMRPNDFLLSEQNGLRYFYMAKKPTQINQEDSNSQRGRMFEIPGSNRCPVAALLKYKSKLNYNLPFFWQKPKKAGRDHGPWYDNVRMGVKRLPMMMKMISSEAGCSTIYTNHSLTYMYNSKFKWY